MTEEKKEEKKVEKKVELAHVSTIKEVKESTMEKRNEAVAGIQVGKKPKYQAHD